MAEPLPAALRAFLRESGPRWRPDDVALRRAMTQAWEELLRQRTASPRVERELAYGPHPRQVLDIHVPEPAAAPGGAQGSEGAPVLVFVHGGAFVRGDRQVSPSIYANVLSEFARHGFVGVNVEYRLAPEAAWPGGAEDVRDALAWVAARIGGWGGDARRIYLMGHSAGCAHCATAAWDERVRPADGPPLRGLVLVSPRVEADVRPENPNAHGVRAYYGEDTALHAQRAPLHQVRPDAPPTFVAIAQYENPLLDFQSFELAHRLAQAADRQHGPMPRVVQCTDHNHLSIVAQFDTPYNALGEEIRDWCARVERGEFTRERRPAA
jgi:acetyl esterase